MNHTAHDEAQARLLAMGVTLLRAEVRRQLEAGVHPDAVGRWLVAAMLAVDDHEVAARLRGDAIEGDE